MARTDPDRVAVQGEGCRVTYAELDEEVDCLAQWLEDHCGTEPHPRVVLRLQDSHAVAVATMAVSRVGMVTVPLDPDTPRARVDGILSSVRAAAVLTDVGSDEPDFDLPAVHPLTSGSRRRVGGDRPAGELGWIIFTSGSSGAPKGVMAPSAMMEATIDRAEQDLRLKPGQRLGVMMTGSGGSGGGSVHIALGLGVTLVSFEIRRLGLGPVGAWLERESIHAIGMVPSILRHLLPTLPAGKVFGDLQAVTLIGEPCTWEDIRALREHLPRDARVVNQFGLSETSMVAELVISTDTPVGTGRVPAGYAVPGVAITIVGPNGEPVATGEPGEIVIESGYCAVGYWGRPDLSRRVFTELPEGRRRVRTGDAGRMRPGGMLEHLGRLDHVVKIAGNRVELGEVETGLRVQPGVAAAAATTYTDAAGDVRLWAYVVAEPDATLHPSVVRSELARRLPGFMLPDGIDVLEELPRLPGGKVDRAGLPPRSGGGHSNGLVSALTPLQKNLASIWQDVLGVERVGLDDDFFELGGDSLRAARVFAAMQEQLGVDHAVSLLVEAPTIELLAAAIESERDPWNTLVPVQPRGELPPLFVVDGLGDVVYARRLAQCLGPNQPLYALRPPGLSGRVTRESSFEEMATSHLTQIMAIARSGPYLLFGMSLGGVIAFEMALQLQRSGRDVRLLAFGDSWAPGSRPVRPPSTKARMEAELGALKSQPLPGAINRVVTLGARQMRHRTRRLVERLSGADRRQARIRRDSETRISQAVMSGSPVDRELRNEFMRRHYGAMNLKYHPSGRFTGSPLLLRTQHPGERDRGWGRWADGTVQVVEIPGRHLDMIREPTISEIGSVLAHALGTAASP